MSDLIQTKLVAAALEIRARAHAPYSGFAVGAALLGEGGSIHAAANVENAAYPLGLCAEAAALGRMVAEGETRIAAIAVAGPGSVPISPCGGCRQRLAEFADPSTPVHLCAEGGSVTTVTLGELLPMAFSARSLTR